MSMTKVTPVRPGAPKIKLSEPLKLSLPTSRSVASTNLSDYTYLIYGERGVGKTSFFTNFDGAFFLFFEPSGHGMNDLLEKYVPSWDHFLEYIKLLEKPENRNFCKLVVIDTGYMAYERCFSYCLKKLGVTDPRDKGWGVGWKFIEKEFRDAHHRIEAAGFRWAVTAHSQVKENMDTKVSKLTTQLGGQAFNFYASVADVIGYFHYKNNRHYLTIRGDEGVEAKCGRIEGRFFYTDETPIKTIPMTETKQGGYENFVKAFNNELIRETVLKPGGAIAKTTPTIKSRK